MIDKLVEAGRTVGQLETKLLQLAAPAEQTQPNTVIKAAGYSPTNNQISHDQRQIDPVAPADPETSIETAPANEAPFENR